MNGRGKRGELGGAHEPSGGDAPDLGRRVLQRGEEIARRHAGRQETAQGVGTDERIVRRPDGAQLLDERPAFQLGDPGPGERPSDLVHGGVVGRPGVEEVVGRGGHEVEGFEHGGAARGIGLQADDRAPSRGLQSFQLATRETNGTFQVAALGGRADIGDRQAAAGEGRGQEENELHSGRIRHGQLLTAPRRRGEVSVRSPAGTGRADLAHATPWCPLGPARYGTFRGGPRRRFHRVA